MSALLGQTPVTGALSNITTLNGAAIASPTVGATVTATGTIHPSAGCQRVITVTTAGQTITLGTTGAKNKLKFILLIRGTTQAVTITNGGAGGGNIGPDASGTVAANVSQLCVFGYDGTNWALESVVLTQ